MVQEPDQIKNHIDTQRVKLEQDLHEIERRVAKAVDWREWFERNPLAMIGAAAAGGFVLSLLIPRSSEFSQNRYSEADSRPSLTGPRQPRSLRRTFSQMDRMTDTLDNTVAALLGVASRKVRDFVADVIPNFREEYREVEANRAGLQGGRTSPRDSSQVSAD